MLRFLYIFKYLRTVINICGPGDCLIAYYRIVDDIILGKQVSKLHCDTERHFAKYTKALIFFFFEHTRSLPVAIQIK